MVASSFASINTSRAMLLQRKPGITVPQIIKSGRAVLAIACATGTAIWIASKFFSAPSTLQNGVRTPAAR